MTLTRQQAANPDLRLAHAALVGAWIKALANKNENEAERLRAAIEKMLINQ